MEKEDEPNVYWNGEFDQNFIEKINSRFARNFTIKDLFHKLGKALTSGEKDVVIDWLTADDLQTMTRDATSAVHTIDEDRILVMVISSFIVNKQNNND